MEQPDKVLGKIVEYGKQVDFGKAANDYGRHRAGYPDELYRRLKAFGVGLPGQRILDLATGTGFLGRGFARGGASVTGLDISVPLMLEARRLDAEAGVMMSYVRSKAEFTPFKESSFDGVSAGQSWHWFDRARAASEARRILRPGGWLLIAHFDWIPLPGNVVEDTERLIQQHNPKWALAGTAGGIPPWPRDFGVAGFLDLETFSFDVMTPYTHEGWRGRIRASAGVGGSLEPAQIAAFDRELAARLRAKFPQDPMAVHHRAIAMIGRVPA
jgi:SAM-dependent methyltransferase